MGLATPQLTPAILPELINPQLAEVEEPLVVASIFTFESGSLVWANADEDVANIAANIVIANSATIAILFCFITL